MAEQEGYESSYSLKSILKRMNPGRKITLIPLVQAKKGERFIARTSPRCKACPKYGFCAQKLRDGFTYEVVQVRDVKHFCPVAKNYMVVAEVRELPLKIAIPKRYALEGAIINFSGAQCDKKKCVNKAFCTPEGIKPGERIKILEILSRSLECPLSYELALVSVQPLS